VSMTGDIRSTAAAIDRLSLLRNHQLFREFDPKITEQLASRATKRSISRGSTVFAKGDEGTGLFGVLAGTVKISILSSEGRELVIALVNPGEVFGEIALLDGRPRTADATAQTNCELFAIERRDFLPFLRSYPDAALKIIEMLCLRLRRTTEQIEDTMFFSLPSRLAKALLQLSASKDKPGTRRRILITQRDIGQLIGMSRESTNKQLREWAKLKWVKLERGAVTVLRPEALSETAADGS
jgi:CRP/FNR family cyclic AMP-dependent transcriptional regulator